jgi:hypothetical protein
VGEEKTAGGFWSFWSSVPGVLTAIAGLITAVAALVGALVAADVIGPASTRATSSPPTTASGASERPRIPAVELERSLSGTKNEMNRPKIELNQADDLAPSKMK